LDARAIDHEGGFFLLLHDVATDCEGEVENTLASLQAGSARRASRVPV